MLAEALCKIEGFTYAPNDNVWWQHGQSTENDFLYATTQVMTHAQLLALNNEVGESRHLLVLCLAHPIDRDLDPNLTLKKIPKEVLSRCDWGQDDYSLTVQNLRPKPVKEGTQLNFL
jgi:adenine-specific DNA-methyltransferase